MAFHLDYDVRMGALAIDVINDSPYPVILSNVQLYVKPWSQIESESPSQPQVTAEQSNSPLPLLLFSLSAMTVEPHTMSRIGTVTMDKALRDSCHLSPVTSSTKLPPPSSSCYSILTVDDQSSVVHFLGTNFKKTQLTAPTVTVNNVTQLSIREVAFSLAVDQTSPFLWLELASSPATIASGASGTLNAGWFSDNNFLAEANVVYRINYFSWSESITVEDLTTRLMVRSLADSHST